jgi:hypothetical protein
MSVVLPTVERGCQLVEFCTGRVSLRDGMNDGKCGAGCCKLCQQVSDYAIRLLMERVSVAARLPGWTDTLHLGAPRAFFLCQSVCALRRHPVSAGQTSELKPVHYRN